MTTKKNTMNGKKAKLLTTYEERNVLTDAKRAELEAFAALYPPEVVSRLHDGLIKHIARILEGDGHEADAKLLGNEIFLLGWYGQAFRRGQIVPQAAGELMGFCNTDDLLEDVAKATRIMAADDLLMTDL